MVGEDLKDSARRIREMHDKYHPEIIIVTQTKATPLGWSIKEAYKTAYPNEEIPRILTIDVKNIVHQGGPNPHGKFEFTPKEEFERGVKSMQKKLKRIGKKGNIVVIDEQEKDPKTISPWKTGKYTFEPKNYDFLADPHTTAGSREVINEAVKRLGYTSKVACLVLPELLDYDIEGVPLPWSADYKKEKGFYLTHKRGKGYSKYPKEMGERVGKEILKQEGLEKKLSFIIATSGIVLGLFFLSPTLTGNTIANITTKTSSIIGAGLFIMGVVSSYFRIKKE